MLATPAAGLTRPGSLAGQAPHQRHSLALHRPQRVRPGRAAALEDVPSVAEVSAPEAATVSPPAAVQLPDITVPDVSGATQQAAESLQGLNDSVSQAAAEASDKAAELASAASQATSAVTDSASKAAAGFTSALTGATSGVADTLGGVSSGISSSLTNLTDSLGQGASSVTGKVSDVAGQVGSTVSSSLAGFKSGLDQATGGVTQVFGQTFDQVSSTTKAATDAVTAAASSGQAAVQQTFDSINSQVAAVSSQVSSTVDATSQQVLDSLPPPVKDAAVAVGGAVAAAGAQAAAHPRVTAIVALAIGAPAAYKYYKGRYGGYAGQVGPVQVADLLTDDDNIFLVDIRPEQQREQDGLPQLKLGARFKVAAFPVQVTIPARVAREAANADELRLLVNAAYIAGLPQCKGPLTKMIIMDSTGSDKARDLARALTSLGQPLSYVMTGGFKAWAAAELPVEEGAAEYNASTGAVLNDELEVIAEKANEALTTVTQPQVGLPLLGGSAFAVYAALNIHTTLEYIGVLGVMLTIVNKALSYDSPQEALDDAKGAVQGVQKTFAKLGSVKLPSVKVPSLPSLPKLPQAPSRATAVAAGGSSGSSGGSSAGLSAATATAAAAVAAPRADNRDVGEETEQELVD